MAKQYAFGSGSLFGTRTDTTNQTPYQFGALQDVSIDVSFDLKELYGQYEFPLAVGRGKAKVTGKAKAGQFNANAFNSLFWGQTSTTGQVLTALNEAGTVPTTPYQVTVSHAAQFADDLGVVVVSTGQPLVLVASAPATGQYSVSNVGVYTFAAADTTIPMYISYSYTATTGFKSTIANQLMGSAPTFAVVFNEIYNGNTFQVKINQCISTKLSYGFKFDDFNMSDFDFSAFADSSNNIMTISQTN